MTGRVQGKVALITGAARGQGRSHAIRLAEEGADIIAVDVCADIEGVPYAGATGADLETTVRQVRSLGRQVLDYRVDVRDLDTLTRVVDEAVAELGRLDIVSANAAIVSFGTAVALSPEQWKTMFDINVTGVWHSCKAAIPHMVEGGRGGAIVITSSVAGLAAMPNNGHYVAAKHAVVGLMRTLALELGPHSIRVNTVHPTNVETPMLTNEATFRLFRPDLEHPSREDFFESAAQMHALPVPWVQPEDISNALLFLASDEARYITGVTLPVDAGALVK